jgi:flagellar biosynthesis/type III secretory pathway protein FliH
MSLQLIESEFSRGKREGFRQGQRAFQERAASVLAQYAATYPGDAVVVDELWGAVMRLREMGISDE